MPLPTPDRQLLGAAPETPTTDPGGEWALVEARAGLTGDELGSIRRWWESAREPNETAVAFLVRQGVLLRRASKEIELVRKGYVVLDTFAHLFAADGRERLGQVYAEQSGTARAPTAPGGTGAQESVRTATGDPSRTAVIGAATVPAPTALVSVVPVTAPGSRPGVAPDKKSSRRGDPPERSGSAEPATAPPGAEVGQVLGKCLLTERVGEGGSGIVFRGLHQGFNIPVAVKVLRVNPDLRLNALLGHEARLLARLNHPNIVRVWDFDDAARPPYMVLEWVDGLSLDDLIRQSGRLSADRATRIATQVAGALAEAHRLGIVHRDVKPANVLLTRDGTAKLADLGLAVTEPPRPPGAAPRSVDRNSIAGTVGYMAPELFTGRPPDHLSDQYALGVLVYQALTGVLPFVGPTRMQYMIQHAEDVPVPPHEVVAGVPPALSAVVLRTLEKDPEARYPSWPELSDALLAADAVRPLPAAGPATGHPLGPPRTASVPPPSHPTMHGVPEPLELPEPDPEPVTPPGGSAAARRSLWRAFFGRKGDGEQP